MKAPALLTIGHSNHPLAEFLRLLSEHRVSLIADVRSSPYSKYLPHFSKDALEGALRDAEVDYLFLGRELGARRAEEICYVDGQARYDRIARLPLFRRGLDNVFEGIEHRNVALMCSEADPLECHRTILVCRELRKLRPELAITHILSDGAEEPHETSEERLVQLHDLQFELFGDLTSAAALVEKAYDLQSEAIAYTKSQVDE
ncbi:MAG: DUF488 domain-containing protein [Candidatus Hydrogenedentota bacterium]